MLDIISNKILKSRNKYNDLTKPYFIGNVFNPQIRSPIKSAQSFIISLINDKIVAKIKGIHILLTYPDSPDSVIINTRPIKIEVIKLPINGSGLIYGVYSTINGSAKKITIYWPRIWILNEQIIPMLNKIIAIINAVLIDIAADGKILFGWFILSISIS